MKKSAKERKRQNQNSERDKVTFLFGNVLFLNAAIQALIEKGVLTGEEIHEQIKKQSNNSLKDSVDSIVTKVQSQEGRSSDDTTEQDSGISDGICPPGTDEASESRTEGQDGSGQIEGDSSSSSNGENKD